jgi:O-antigen ligase
MAAPAATAPGRRSGFGAAPTGPLMWATAAIGLAAATGLVVASGRAYIALDVVLVVVAAFAIARWPHISVLVLFALIPKDSLFLELLVVAAAVIVLVRRLDWIPARVVTVSLTLLVLLALVKLRWHPDPQQNPILPLPGLGWEWLPTMAPPATAWLRLCFVLVAFLLAAWALGEQKWVRRALWVAVAASAWPIAVGLKQYANGDFVATSASGGRASFRAVESVFTHPNGFAFYLVVVIGLLVLAFIQARTTPTRIALLVLLAGAGVCLMHTYTRSAWIGAAALLVVMGAWRWRRLLAVGGVALILAAIAFPQTTKVVQQRFGDLSSQSEAHASNSWSWRTGQWEKLLPLGSQHPFSGTGFGTYPEMTVRVFGVQDPRYPTFVQGGQPGFAAHNDYVRMFVEMGVPGLVLWVAVLGGLFVSLARRARHPAVGDYAVTLAATTLVLAAISFADNVQAYTVPMFYLFALSGAVIAATRRISSATASANRSARSADQAAALPAGGS